MPPSIVHVAELADVSRQTVSRVLNHHPSVRPGTRQRVLDAIQQLGYRRNSAARALATRRTGTIGVLTTGSALHGPVSTLVALEEAARRAGFFLVIGTLRGPGTTAAVGAVVEHLLAQGVEGIVAVAAGDTVAQAVQDLQVGVPLVLVSGRGDDASPGPDGDPGRTGASIDQRLAARLATGHLLGLGHRTVTHLGGPTDWFDAREREQGWAETLRAAGAPVPAVVRCGWTADSGYEAGLRLAAAVRRGDGPTAVFAGNDHVALGLLHACAEAGVDVPGRLSVVGVDDVQGAAHFVPPLTTVRQPFDELGRRAMTRMLLALGDDPPPTAPGPVRPELVVRATTAPPPPA